MQRQVVVTGVGLVCPLGDTPAELRAARLAGRSALKDLTRFEPGGLPRHAVGELRFDGALALGQERNLRPLDRISQLVAAAAQRALEDAGLTREQLERLEAGLLLGTMFCGLRTIAEFDRRGLERGPAYVSPFDFANTVINAAAGQSAIWHGLTGINSTLAGAAAGLQAIAQAADLIRAGRARVLLCGGADELSFEGYAGFARAGLLSSAPVPFDVRRDGFALSEGAGLLVLEEGQAARERGARILGEICGGGSAYDASRGADASSAAAAGARAIRSALRDARLDAERIGAIASGASGSVKGDRAEGLALHDGLEAGAALTPLTCLKGQLGEGLGASGAWQAIDMLTSLQERCLPGVPGLFELEAGLALDLRPEPRELRAGHALALATGFDGACAALVLGRAA